MGSDHVDRKAKYSRFKKLVAALSLDKAMWEEVLSKSFKAFPQAHLDR
jgi:hypothetical protein